MNRTLITLTATIITFVLSATLYAQWVLNTERVMFSMIGALGFAGLLIMILTVFAGFIVIVNSRHKFRSNLQMGVAMCSYAGLAGLIVVVFKTAAAMNTDVPGMVFGIHFHLLVFTIIAAASAGAGGSLIAVDIALNQNGKR